jgi:nucleoside-diphosphate-sugar epimerase
MKIAVTGATGFVGQHLVPCLLSHGHSVIAVARTRARSEQFAWHKRVEFIECDVHRPEADAIGRISSSDLVIHLAWPGLPNYGDAFHVEDNYRAAYDFLKSLMQSGLKRLLVTGTCFEYGLQNGCLTEEHPAIPINAYGTAKDFLRRSLELIAPKFDVTLCWARLFYMYGPGQKANSVLAQLDEVLLRGETVFKMSGGEQLRDYLPVTTVAEKLRCLAENDAACGVFNICSGQPISIRSLVESHMKQRQAKVVLELGFYPYSPNEPLAFWGDCKKLDSLLGKL